jgi:hypothetical protein
LAYLVFPYGSPNIKQLSPLSGVEDVTSDIIETPGISGKTLITLGFSPIPGVF